MVNKTFHQIYTILEIRIQTVQSPFTEVLHVPQIIEHKNDLHLHLTQSTVAW
jgi:hypothetical protein